MGTKSGLTTVVLPGLCISLWDWSHTGGVISRPRIGQSESEIGTQCGTIEGTLRTFRPDHLPEVTLECNKVLGSRIEDLCQNVLLAAVTLAHTYTS